jgi:hypothetical protein
MRKMIFKFRQVSFYTRVMFLKNIAQVLIVQIEHKFPIKNSIFRRG